MEFGICYRSLPLPEHSEVRFPLYQTLVQRLWRRSTVTSGFFLKTGTADVITEVFFPV